ATGFLLAPLTTSCSALVTQMSEEQAAQILRVLTKDGKLPPESAVLDIENKFSKTKTGALAKLLRARIRYETSDFGGAAQILNSTAFREKTTVADYALWLRGKSLQQSGNHVEAMNVFAELVQDFPNSIRARESKGLWATSALQSGQADRVPDFLKDLNDKNQPDALLLTAKSYEARTNQTQAINFYRKVYFYGAGTDASREAETKLTALGQMLTPQSAEEIQTRADRFYDAKKYAEAQTAYSNLIISFPNAVTPAINLKRLNTFANLRLMSEAQGVFNMIPLSANEKAEGFYSLARGYANARLWAQARQTVEEMRQKFPAGNWTTKTFVAVGTAARDAKNTLEESYFLRSAVTFYPNAVDVAGAQFELAWNEHENNNLPVASQMLTEHLARYADKDTTNRGKAGYWAARDSERAAKTAEACALYEAVLYRYGANWYGYLALQRLTTLRGQGKCQTTPKFPADSSVAKAVANLKTVTVAAETSTAKELERAENSEQLSTIGLFEWAIEELQEAKKTAQNSPNINLALARHYRFRGDNVNALLTLAKSYPDYSQMFPEEMGREEWSIFYPLTNWNDIKLWARSRNLDSYTVAGLIRQESVFNAKAKSGANAYGLMQLLIPTARSTAKKYGSSAVITGESLFQPALNIELGTAYMRDQFNKFGRIEFVAVAYNAGPGRVPQWQATLPYEMDEFVEEIPFRETRGYVQGVIRNSAQYRRLYDENGNFKSNVGTRALRGEIDAKSREQFAQEFPEIVLDENKNSE
ncbi:MAG: lytic transglycosylase domain-containing protein, partial [Acidobacteriota bacterium]|nr:lytic transglycosylase domain-containing protein [Acidobacteriota bacterium]